MNDRKDEPLSIFSLYVPTVLVVIKVELVA